MLLHLLHNTFQNLPARQNLRGFFKLLTTIRTVGETPELLNSRKLYATLAKSSYASLCRAQQIQLFAETERISPQAWKSGSSPTQGRKPDLFPLKFSYPKMLLKLIVSDTVH